MRTQKLTQKFSPVRLEVIFIGELVFDAEDIQQPLLSLPGDLRIHDSRPPRLGLDQINKF